MAYADTGFLVCSFLFLLFLCFPSFPTPQCIFFRPSDLEHSYSPCLPDSPLPPVRQVHRNHFILMPSSILDSYLCVSFPWFAGVGCTICSFLVSRFPPHISLFSFFFIFSFYTISFITLFHGCFGCFSVKKKLSSESELAKNDARKHLGPRFCGTMWRTNSKLRRHARTIRHF